MTSGLSRSIFGWLVLALASGLLAPLAQAESGSTAALASGLLAPLARAESGSTAAASWSRFRGPGQDGVSLETGLLRSWPESGPEVIWRRSFGSGYSGFAVAGDVFYTLFAEDGEEFLGSFRVENGDELWRLAVGAVFEDEFGTGPRSTPTVVDKIVYALGARGRLVAAHVATGALLWQVEFTESYGFYGPQWSAQGATEKGLQLPNWGYSYSPLVEGDLIVVDTGHGDGESIVAFDRWTGKPRWSALDGGVGYASPMSVDLDGQRQIVILAPNEVVGLSPNGEIAWRRPWAMTISQPVFLPPDKIFVSTVGHEVGAMVFKVDGSVGKPETEVVWTSGIMRSLWSSSVAWDGHLYGFDNATFRCLSAATGAPCWAKRGLGKGSLVAADGLLVVLSDQGMLTLVEATPDAFRKKGEVRIFDGARTWTPPAIAGGKLFLRGPDEIVCLDLVHRRGPAGVEGPSIAVAQTAPTP